MRSASTTVWFVSALLTLGIAGLGWQNKLQSQQITDLRQEVHQQRLLQRIPTVPVATAGEREAEPPRPEEVLRSAGLLLPKDLRELSKSFVEMKAGYDNGATSYGTAGYVGNGYFITVKHGIENLSSISDTKITSVRLRIKGELVRARVIDKGNAQYEVDPGDWAILKVDQVPDIPALAIAMDGYEYGDLIYRIGNDYDKGLLIASGYLGNTLSNKLITALTDGHPGVSGGGVLNSRGELIGIPIGRMQGDFRFSYILPLRKEMFRKISLSSGP